MSSNLLDLVGNTPLLEIKRLNPNPKVQIFAKLEFMNPGGSVKDRVAKALIDAAEASGELTPDKTIIEATSGNTGIGLAMAAAVKGYKIRLLMPETASEERKMIMRAYGAEIALTPGRLSTDGAIELAYRMAREEPEKYVLMDQFNNPASVAAHFDGTGLEIWEQTQGKLTHCVICLGTSGTASGICKRLKKENPNVYVAAMEPYAGHKIQGLKNMHESYPPGIYDKTIFDEIMHVEDETAFDYCRRLAREEGLFVGMSSGAAMAAAAQLAERLESGMVVTLFPDGGERYLSTHLFRPREEGGVRLRSAAADGLVTLPPSAGRVYTIGPSLDNPGGLDAWRRMVLGDVLARYLRQRGGEARLVAGLADMDDRTLAACRVAKAPLDAFARARRDEIAALADSLGLDMGGDADAALPLASASVTRCLELCRKMLAKGLAYEKLRSVYFDVFRDRRYGDLGGLDMDSVSAGRTVDLDAYVKDNPLDFTLLKRASLQDLKEGRVVETEWGNVRPSWFLQHAAAALDSLGTVDVFVGSEAHQFPHLENLRAIWTVAGAEPKAWLVDMMVQAEDGEKPRLGQLLERAESPREVRMWLLSGSYRKSLSASEKSLAMWSRNWRKVQEASGTLALALHGAGKDAGEAAGPEAEQLAFDLKAGFTQALEDDLSLHRFWPALFAFAKGVNALDAAGKLTPAAARVCRDRLLAVDEVLGILDADRLPLAEDELPDAVRELVARRQAAREAKDFGASDRLRDELAAQGYRVEDTPAGPRLFRA